jgi:hypothetical protein
MKCESRSWTGKIWVKLRLTTQTDHNYERGQFNVPRMAHGQYRGLYILASTCSHHYGQEAPMDRSTLLQLA